MPKQGEIILIPIPFSDLSLQRRRPVIVIHRDIKPQNFKLTPEGQIILLDFGLAKGGVTRNTLTGRSLHGYTLGYAPPEQMAGQPTDARSDPLLPANHINPQVPLHVAQALTRAMALDPAQL